MGHKAQFQSRMELPACVVGVRPVLDSHTHQRLGSSPTPNGVKGVCKSVWPRSVSRCVPEVGVCRNHSLVLGSLLSQGLL